MNRNAQAGFTLLELLVGMALIGIVLTALLNFFTQGGRVSTQSSSRADLQQETLNAQQLIAGKLREAFYVWPVSQTIELSSTAGNTAAPTYRNPVPGTTRSGKSTWKTGDDPILALILPPKTTGAACAVASGGTAAQNDGCYLFLAYYPVKRSVWVGNTTGSNNPGADTTNDETWVLVQYKAYWYTGFTPSSTATAVPTAPTTGDAQILADYVAPTVATTGFTTSSNTYTMFTYTAANGATTTATNPVTGVTLNLATTRTTGGTTLRLPGSTGTYSITVYPNNLGKVTAN
ncbi:type II secretion system protein [Deinococcus phoenicis]|nr:type II secretion system protein [Deinococcus phoenicis]